MRPTAALITSTTALVHLAPSWFERLLGRVESDSTVTCADGVWRWLDGRLIHGPVLTELELALERRAKATRIAELRRGQYP